MDRRLHRWCRPRVRRADPAAWRRRAGRRRDESSTSAAATVRSAACWRRVVLGWLASIRRGTRSAWRTSAVGALVTSAPAADDLPFADASFDAAVACLVFEHIDDVDAAIAEVARVAQAGWPVLLLPQPSAAADTGQRLDRRPHDRPARAVLADRPVPRRERDDRAGRARRLHPVHPPPAVALRERARRARAGARTNARAGTSARIPRAGAGVHRSGHDSAAAVSPAAPHDDASTV